MKRGLPGGLALMALLAALAAGAAPTPKASLEDLCRAHGIDRESGFGTVSRAFSDALEAGISEEELYPFVQEILEYRLDADQTAKVLAATASLRRADLPYFVIFSKVREGVAKAAPPALVAAAAEAKLKTLCDSRDVLKSLESAGYRVLDYKNAAIVVSSYLERGYSPQEVVRQVRQKGLEGAGFEALSVVVERPLKRKER